ncbi:ComF family protein [candidate division KSB1 bacterium]|nr:ComF family protein [candidate division KSB1 bacterium]
MLMKLTRFIHDLAGLIYPVKCLICDGCEASSRTQLLCENCLREISSRPLPETIGGQNRTANYSGLDSAFAGWHYDAAMQSIIHATKYRRRPSLGQTLGDLLAQRLSVPLRDELAQAVVVPVPLHRRRQRKRGFNQSLVLARALAKVWHLEVMPNALRRTRFTQPQAKLGAAERWENVEGAFAPARVLHLETPTIFLVDDVLTTGATMNACAVALKSAGASKVIGVALARAG